MKIEGDNISAHEVAHRLDLLKADIMLRQEEKYLDPEAEEEKSILIQNSEGDEATIDNYCQQFHGKHSLITYI